MNTNSNPHMVDMAPVLQDQQNEEGEAMVSRLVGSGLQFLQAQGWTKEDLMNYINLTTSGDDTIPLKKGGHSGSVTSSSSTMNDASYTTNSSSREIKEDRPHVNDGAWFTLAYMGVILFFIVVWVTESIRMSMEDGFWYRCIWFLLTPLYIVMAMLPFRIAIYTPLVLLGSWRNILKNSTYHSAIASPRPAQLPPVCVQMPVYKEDFEQTIFPSLEDILQAIYYYRSQGGKAYMFINDDGLQLLDDEGREERLKYYHENDIAYIARPSPKLLARHGLFKKASNMNFCLNFALELADVEEEANGTLTKAEAIQKVIDSRDYPILAGGPIDVGTLEYILLVDSDTRVPKDCLAKTVGEFYLNRNVGFIQHATSVLRVDYNYWEDMLSHFTKLLYSVYIPIGTACGEPSPLVGHNATLNWRAVREVSWYDDEVGYRKFWSESHVSEDFDLSLRFQSAGYIGRYATYTGDGFKEGVSVTVHDEVKKLKKFAFGSGEMLFNPFSEMCRKGVFCDLIKAYVKQTAVPLHARINMIGYLYSYIAMAFGLFSLPFQFYVAAMDGYDMNMLTPWELMIGTIIIFAIIGNATVVCMTFLLGHHTSLFSATFMELKQLIPFGIFFMGLQYHIFTSFARYMLKMKAEWGATVKEIDDADYSLKTLFGQIFDTVRAYWDMYLFCLAAIGFFIYCFMFGPEYMYWSNFAMSPFTTFLGAHMLMPLVMNPTATRCIYMPPYLALMWILRCGKKPATEDVDELDGDASIATNDLENPPTSHEKHHVPNPPSPPSQRKQLVPPMPPQENKFVPAQVQASRPVAAPAIQRQEPIVPSTSMLNEQQRPLIDFASPDQAAPAQQAGDFNDDESDNFSI